MKKRGFETCAECPEVLRCDIFVRRRVSDWVPAVENLRRIKEKGLRDCLKGQTARQKLVEKLLADYNEGRSMSFFCKACARMPIDLVDKAFHEAQKRLLTERIDESDMKSKARLLKAIVKDLAAEANIDLSK